MEADVIIVIDNGEIIERGTHEELISQGKKYFELWTKQTVGKGSNVASKANSFLVPDDVRADLRNDLLPTTSTNELQKALVDLDNEDDTSVSQLDGACESKGAKEGEDTACFGLIKHKKESSKENGGSSSSSSSSQNQDEPIHMVSARSTTGTTSSTTKGEATPRSGFDQSLRRTASSNTTNEPPNSMQVEPGSRKASTGVRPSLVLTRTSSSVSVPLGACSIPKVTVESPNASSSSANSGEEKELQIVDPTEHKSVKERKPTGYPKDMPGGTDTDSSSSAVDRPSMFIPIELSGVSPSIQEAGIMAPQPTPLGAIDPRNEASSSNYSKRSSERGESSDDSKNHAYFDSTRVTRRPTQGSLEAYDDKEEIHGGVERFDTASED
jgi:hypothetical protein